MATYKEWDEHWDKISVERMRKYQEAIKILMSDPMLKKDWRDLELVAILMENAIGRRKNRQRTLNR
jgi:hypothetical protein